MVDIRAHALYNNAPFSVMLNCPAAAPSPQVTKNTPATGHRTVALSRIFPFTVRLENDSSKYFRNDQKGRHTVVN